MAPDPDQAFHFDADPDTVSQNDQHCFTYIISFLKIF
jgi:hypothetical protein